MTTSDVGPGGTAEGVLNALATNLREMRRREERTRGRRRREGQEEGEEQGEGEGDTDTPLRDANFWKSCLLEA